MSNMLIMCVKPHPLEIAPIELTNKIVCIIYILFIFFSILFLYLFVFCFVFMSMGMRLPWYSCRGQGITFSGKFSPWYGFLESNSGFYIEIHVCIYGVYTAPKMLVYMLLGSNSSHKVEKVWCQQHREESGKRQTADSSFFIFIYYFFFRDKVSL